jgi:hypothetical protein
VVLVVLHSAVLVVRGRRDVVAEVRAVAAVAVAAPEAQAAPEARELLVPPALPAHLVQQVLVLLPAALHLQHGLASAEAQVQ